MTDELTKRVQELAFSDDADGIYQLLLSWEPRNTDWAFLVRSKISAPSTTQHQKTFLERLLNVWQSDSGIDAQQLDQYFEEKIAGHLKETDTKPSLFSLDQHYEGFDEIIKSIRTESRTPDAGQSSEWIEILRRLKQEDLLKEKLQREHHQYLLQNDPENTDAGFETYIQEIKFIFSQVGDSASTDQVDQLSSIASATLPSDLISFYSSIGGIHGDLFNGYLNLKLFSANALITALQSDERPDKLQGLNLYDMIQLSWSNHRPELKKENGFSESTIDELKQPLCIGWFSDGYMESHAYIISAIENQFGLFYWHQDDDLGAQALQSMNHYSLSGLITKIIGDLDKTIGKNIYDLSSEELDDLFDEIEIDCYLLNSMLNA